jgi:hypothetical protein
MSKVCSKCGAMRDLSEFHNNASSKDGLQRVCKECMRAYGQTDAAKARVRAYNRSDAGRAARHKHAKSAAGKAYKRTYRNTVGKEYHRAYERSDARKAARARTVAKNPFQRKAQSRVAHAIASGRMERASNNPCEKESAKCLGVHHHHHDSYLEGDWLVVRVLCRYHHTEWHLNNTPTPHALSLRSRNGEIDIHEQPDPTA